MSDIRPEYMRHMMAIINREFHSFGSYRGEKEFEIAIKGAMRMSKAKWTEKDIDAVTAKVVYYNTIKRITVENLLPFAETVKLRGYDRKWDFGEHRDISGPNEWKPSENDDQPEASA